MSINLNKNKGFTLIELLVVASIVSLLSAVVLSSLNDARRKSRNTARIELVYNLRTALMMGFNETGSFPAGSGCLTTLCNGWGASAPAGVIAQNATIDAYLAPYLPVKSDDSAQGKRTGVGIPYWYSIYPGAAYPYPTGTYMDYQLEGPVSSCGPGASPRAGNWVGSPWLECLVPLR